MTLDKLNQLIRENKLILFYISKVWKRKRKEILIRDNYECQECKKENKLTLIQHTKLDIHHIKELKYYPELALDNNNLITICVYHHNILDNRIKTKDKFINEERW